MNEWVILAGFVVWVVSMVCVVATYPERAALAAKQKRVAEMRQHLAHTKFDLWRLLFERDE